jgi:hypothetical protein
MAFVLGVAGTLAVQAWRTCGSHGATCSEAGQYFPMHDADTDLFGGVVYDLSANGKVETFVSMGTSGSITEIAVDVDEDGRIDRLLQPDTNGTLRDVAVPGSESVGDGAAESRRGEEGGGR